MSEIANQIKIRDVSAGDIPLFFQFQLNEEANQMAAFTSEDPSDKQAFLAHWNKIQKSEKVNIKTILYNNTVVGSVLSYSMFDELQISFWIGNEFWGKGISTQGVKLFLSAFPDRPIYGRAAFDNIGSQLVMAKNGFVKTGEDKYFANARNQEIVEYIYKLS